jgi:hypothetical protein
MLTDSQIERVWEKMLEAEVRSYYFGDLAARSTKCKQWITAALFFLSSGAAATLAARLPALLPIALSSIAAVLTGYSIAADLDKQAYRMSKLHADWNRIADEYDRLWSNWYASDAEAQFDEILKRARDASELGTDAPYDERLIEKWQDRVFQLRGLPASA